MREAIKKPLTEKAFGLIISKLNGMANDDSEKVLILEQSILNNWQGVFPLKDKPAKSAPDVKSPLDEFFGGS